MKLDLVKEANLFLKENFNMTLDIPIERNNRLSRSLGRFLSRRMYGGPNRPLRIEMAGRCLDHEPLDIILGVLKHELVHYAHCVLGKPFLDGHPVFENKLKDLGIPATFTITSSGPKHHYTCGCQTFSRVRRLASNRTYSCQACKGKLEYVGYE